MTTYRLPDGTQAEESTGLIPYATPPGNAWVKHEHLGWILIDRDKLTEVPPPLPEEPPAGFVVLDKDGDPQVHIGSG